MFYLVRFPRWLRWIYPGCIWEMPREGKRLYLTFDDGPHPEVTTFVLDELKKHDAKASFFCIGKNVAAYPAIYRRIIEEGHAVGNHSFSHMRSLQKNDRAFMDDIEKARHYIDSDLFRPPYGKINRFQFRLLRSDRFKLRMVMWTVLSGDFDTSISSEKCLNNVLLHATSGSIVVMHDSEKCKQKIREVLPTVLKKFAENGYSFDRLY
jgi:peptidoglycan/xylan/chitin deacetylase (PgdA/CDA1 family)